MINCPVCLSPIPDNSSKCPICGNANVNAPSCAPLKTGYIISSKYKIEGVLGDPGGFGITYLARDEELKRKVAIKEYFPDRIATRTGDKVSIPPTLDNKEDLQKFKEEARSIAKLDNPGIVKIHDIIEENGTFYIVMEYIEGKPLSSLLGKIDEKEAVKYIKQVAKAVGAIHAAHMIHQDIKPDNIMLNDSGELKIIDFGSSRVFVADKTKTYEKILTPGYAPLEQYGAKGRRGEYTDVYAICATLYALVKGIPPPEATELVGEENIDFNGISEKLKGILKKGLSIEIPKRIQNTVELIKLLDELEKPEQVDKQQPQPKAPNQTSPSYNPPKQKKSKNFNKTIIIMAIVTGIIFIVLRTLTISTNRKQVVVSQPRTTPTPQYRVHPIPKPKPVTTPTPQYRVHPVPETKVYQRSAPPNRRNFVPRVSPQVFNGPGYEDFKASDCFYCHRIYKKGKPGGSDLSHIGSRLSYVQIENQITHPSSFTMPPSSNMPTEEVAQIAGWLESLK